MVRAAMVPTATAHRRATRARRGEHYANLMAGDGVVIRRNLFE
jgi:hypothetical protein